MNATLCPMPKFREVTNAGAPLNGGKLYTAQPGTVAGPTQTYPKATYTDNSGNIANTNPIVLDSSGRANIWLSGAYSMALYDSAGVLIWTADNVQGVAASATNSTVQIFGDATSAIYNVSILSANDVFAPTYYEVFKIDSSANSVRITPASGTVGFTAFADLTVQGESIRITKNATDNNWYPT